MAEYMTVAQVAKKFAVSKMTIYRMIHDGSLRYVKVGRQFRIPAEDVRRLEES